MTTLSNFSVTVSAASPYQSWVASQPGLIALPEPLREPLADPDADGVVNLLEFALGGTPTDSASRNLPALGTTEVSGQPRLTLSFTPQQVPGVRYIVQASSDLSDWTDQTDLTDLLTAGQTFTFTDSANLGLTPRRFLRLRISL